MVTGLILALAALLVLVAVVAKVIIAIPFVVIIAGIALFLLYSQRR
jgi:hypothetical protein